MTTIDLKQFVRAFCKGTGTRTTLAPGTYTVTAHRDHGQREYVELNGEYWVPVAAIHNSGAERRGPHHAT